MKEDISKDKANFRDSISAKDPWSQGKLNGAPGETHRQTEA